MEDDRQIGVKSTALLFGSQPRPWLAGFGLAMSGLLVAAGMNSGQAWPYYLGVAASLGHVMWQVGGGGEGEGVRVGG